MFVRAVGGRIAVVLVGLALVGCAPVEEGAAEGRAAGAPGGRWSSCVEVAPETTTVGFMVTAPDGGALPRLDDGFTPVAVVVCGQETQQRPDGGQDRVLTERRAEEVDGLTAALRLADEPPTNGLCTRELSVAPWLVLVDADGRWVRPGLPLDRCGKLRSEVRDALAALPMTTVSTRTVAELVSAEAAAAGCSQDWKDTIALETETTVNPGVPREALPAPLPTGRQIRLCVYEVRKSEPGTGSFVHGTVLTPQRSAAIGRALREAGPVRVCTEQASRFALLWATTGEDPQTYVELDGCHRVMVVRGDGSVPAQGDAALAELIDER
ncbi:hypothetical protein E1211_02045 [Micromonospora sp. 15K316]|uniref:hypothetical protein n=1 Tax=Micromonospora sp. 15K316 TaxID=2530376 RepID=UPI001050E704|nr:hypothetical protein [Micromonospora sp. 15K316]TDC40042.1 hypothetical protein E1211_02045 [Micromonospora sp. 15K316]